MKQQVTAYLVDQNPAERVLSESTDDIRSVLTVAPLIYLDWYLLKIINGQKT